MSEVLTELFGPWLPWAILLCLLLAAVLVCGGWYVRTFGQIAEFDFAYKAGSAAVAIGIMGIVSALAAYPFKWYFLPSILEVLGTFSY
jgi:hypothetical protein